MKTALSVPDDVFAEAERLAHRTGKSRSRLYTDAVREYVARHDPDAVTAALNRVYGDAQRAEGEGQHGSDADGDAGGRAAPGRVPPELAAAAARLLAGVEW